METIIRVAVITGASQCIGRPAEDTGAEEWRRVLEVNLTGPFLLCRAFGKLMLRQGEGAI